MRIHSITAENFKRLHVVELTLEGGVFVVAGRNAQGKSSVIDALWAALGGGAAAPEMPIHTGETSAKVTINLGDLVVTRRWTSAGSTELRVETPAGARYNSPQAVLDKLIGKLCFDPCGFVRMTEKEQAKILRDVTGLDVSDLDANRTTAYAARTPLNANAKMLQAQADGIVVPVAPADPGDDVSIAALSAEYGAASKVARQNDAERAKAAELARAAERAESDYNTRRSGYAALKAGIQAAKERAEVLIREAERAGKAAIEAAEKAVADAEAEGAKARDAAARASQLAVEAAESAGALVDPDVDALAEKMRQAEHDNREKAAVRRAISDSQRIAADKLKRSTEAKQAADRAAEKTAEIDAIDAEKAARLAAATMPIDGLTVDGDTVRFNGVPLKQASSAEQLRVGLAIGAALNPTLRVIAVRDGSLLDADSMVAVATWAQENDMQVIMERVGDIGSSIGVIIEDGRVSGA